MILHKFDIGKVCEHKNEICSENDPHKIENPGQLISVYEVEDDSSDAILLWNDDDIVLLTWIFLDS